MGNDAANIRLSERWRQKAITFLTKTRVLQADRGGRRVEGEHENIGGIRR